MKIMLFLSVTLIMDTCAPASYDQMKQRQEIVNLCEARGGIPILNQSGDKMDRCDFPPIVGNPRIER